jgi:hypothetical protein
LHIVLRWMSLKYSVSDANAKAGVLRPPS